VQVSGCVGSEQKVNESAEANDIQKVNEIPEQELPQAVKYRIKQKVTNGRQSRSEEIKQLSLTTPAVESQLVALNNKKKQQRSTSCVLRRAINGIDDYDTCLVKKMFGQFREVVKTDGDEEREEKRKDKLGLSCAKLRSS
jgi:hypothetical protein